MRFSAASLFVLASGLVASCGDSLATPVQCMGMGASDIVAQSALVTIQIYDDTVTCDGSVVSSGSPAPLFSRSFAQGQPISLDVPPGKHTVALMAYSDAAGDTPIGGGCAQAANFQPGQQVCLDLTVGIVDAAAAPACQTTGCPDGQYCAPTGECEPGCKSSAECGSGADGGAMLLCDPVTHRCVGCAVDTDCGSGQTCCNGTCAKLQSDPLHCGSCERTCSGTASSCCNGVCSTIATDVNNCGACGKACGTLNASSMCGAGTCSFSCNSGYVHCSGTSGCECATDPAAPACCGAGCQTKHDTGLNVGQGASKNWYDCSALNTYTQAEATAACNAFIGSMSGWACNPYSCKKGGNNQVICADYQPGGTITCNPTYGSPCWTWSGNNVGHVFDDPTCMSCPGSLDPTWH